MPRRLPVRPAKILGNFFVLFILFVIFFVYYAFVFVTWGPRANGKSITPHSLPTMAGQRQLWDGDGAIFEVCL